MGEKQIDFEFLTSAGGPNKCLNCGGESIIKAMVGGSVIECLGRCGRELHGKRNLIIDEWNKGTDLMQGGSNSGLDEKVPF